MTPFKVLYQYVSSGLYDGTHYTQKKFCEEFDISYASFKRWAKNKYPSAPLAEILYSNLFANKPPTVFLEFSSYLQGQGWYIESIPDTTPDTIKPHQFTSFTRFLTSELIPETKHKDKKFLSSTIVELDKDGIFIGRDTLIDDIHSTFEAHPTIFLYGIGGIGKSELAKQYYHKYKSYYNKVIFARYNREKTFATLLANDQIFKIQGVSRKIKNVNGNEETQSDDEYALEKINVLKKICDDKTLIIIDNFDTDISTEHLFSVFTNNIPYRVLVTTRNSQSDYKTIPVSELDDNSLKTLFLKYYGDKSGHIDFNDPVFDELFTWTDRHTLTIELIAKYMKNSVRVTSLRSMLDRLNTMHLNVFSDSSNRGESQKSYDRIIDILRISDLSDDEKYFLRCLSLMPAAGIKYLNFFEKWILRENDIPCDSDNILYKLSELSFVKQNKREGIIYLHPIIREIVINELHPSYENCKNFVDRCAMVGTDVIPIMCGLPYEEKIILLECYTNFLNNIPEININTYPLYINISHMYNFAGEYSKSIALHDRLYTFACSYFGKNSTDAMLILNRIGWKNSNCMLYDIALPYCKTAADWFLENPCYTSREAQSVIQNCGNIYYYMYKQTHNTSDLENAHDYLNKYVEYGEKMVESTLQESEYFKLHLKYQNDCICKDYFKLYLEERNYPLAKKCLEKYRQVVRDFAEKSRCPTADMVGYFRHLAKLEYEQENYLEACEAFKESYKLYLHYFSSESPRTISILEELIQCYIKLEDYPQISKYLSLALKNASAVFTEDHPTLIKLIELSKKYTKQ